MNTVKTLVTQNYLDNRKDFGNLYLWVGTSYYKFVKQHIAKLGSTTLRLVKLKDVKEVNQASLLKFVGRGTQSVKDTQIRLEELNSTEEEFTIEVEDNNGFLHMIPVNVSINVLNDMHINRGTLSYQVNKERLLQTRVNMTPGRYETLILNLLDYKKLVIELACTDTTKYKGSIFVEMVLRLTQTSLEDSSLERISTVYINSIKKYYKTNNKQVKSLESELKETLINPDEEYLKLKLEYSTLHTYLLKEKGSMKPVEYLYNIKSLEKSKDRYTRLKDVDDLLSYICTKEGTTGKIAKDYLGIEHFRKLFSNLYRNITVEDLLLDTEGFKSGQIAILSNNANNLAKFEVNFKTIKQLEAKK